MSGGFARRRKKFTPFYQKWKISEIKQIVDAIGIDFIDDEYIKSTHPHNWKCRKHNFKFKRSFSTILNGGFHCIKCRDEVGQWNDKVKDKILDFNNKNSYWAKNKKILKDRIKQLGITPARGKKMLTIVEIGKIVNPIMKDLKIDSSQYIISPTDKTDLRKRPIVIGNDLRSKQQYIKKSIKIYELLSNKKGNKKIYKKYNIEL